jgi:hypothetical protein
MTENNRWYIRKFEVRAVQLLERNSKSQLLDETILNLYLV